MLKGKKICSILCIMLLSFTLHCETTNAATKSANQVLKDLGVQQTILNLISNKDKAYYQQCYNQNSIQVSNVVIEYDIITELSDIASSTDAELRMCGVPDQDIKRLRQKIRRFQSLSDTELKTIFNMKDNIELKLFRKALNGDSKNFIKKQNTQITASGSYSQSELNLTQIVTSKQYPYTNPPYSVDVYFGWVNPVDCITGWEDSVAIAWGGNFRQS